MMELWIRSQDKKRIFKINNIGTYDDGEIVQVFENGDAIRLATYKTEERALEVLNEIEYFLNGKNVLKKMLEEGQNMDNLYPVIYYQMPEN